MRHFGLAATVVVAKGLGVDTPKPPIYYSRLL